MALGSFQPLTEISTRNITWGEGGRCVGLITLHLPVSTVLKSARINLLETSRPVKVCNGIALPFSTTRQTRYAATYTSRSKYNTPHFHNNHQTQNTTIYTTHTRHNTPLITQHMHIHQPTHIKKIIHYKPHSYTHTYTL
jgi:hypothetical protein